MKRTPGPRLLQVGIQGLRTGGRVHWNVGAISGTHALLGGALFLAGGVVLLYWSWKTWRRS